MRFALLAVVSVVLAACAQTPSALPRPQAADAPDTQSEPQTISAEGPYTQAASGMTFPAVVGGFQRTGINRYRADGSDESAAYSLFHADGGFILATVFVYPSPDMPAAYSVGDPSARSRRCQFQFLMAHNEVVMTAPNAELVARGEINIAQGTAQYVGPSAAYLFSPDGAPETADPSGLLGSELHLFCYVGGTWSVKYRFSYPAGYAAHDEIRAFMNALTLTIGHQQRDDSLSAERETEEALRRAG